MIAIADYGMGNRRSVEKALAHVGAESTITTDVSDASAIILPGVGAFPEAMRHLERSGLGEQLIERAAAGVPLLGICLGMQLLFESSTEHEGAPGLGILPGTVTRLQSPRLPHIGWNLVSFERDSALTEGLGDAAAFYHVHSFACRPSDAQDVVGTSEYGERFVSVVERDNVMASQFHPEKSSRDGLRMLRNFAQLAAVAVA
jgi:glutamine amidotransferase